MEKDAKETVSEKATPAEEIVEPKQAPLCKGHGFAYGKLLFLFILISIIGLWFIMAFPRLLFDWEDAVDEHVSAYSCKLKWLGSFQDSESGDIVYRFQTDDERGIMFDVRCFWGAVRSPFGFNYPLAEKPYTVDNFGEQIGVYVSEVKGTYYIDDASGFHAGSEAIEGIAKYIENTQEYCVALHEAYGVEYLSPKIAFRLWKGDRAYSFVCETTNAELLRKKLYEFFLLER